jgi:hypothetical protein
MKHIAGWHNTDLSEEQVEWAQAKGIRTYFNTTRSVDPWRCWREPTGPTGCGKTEKASIENLCWLLNITPWS